MRKDVAGPGAESTMPKWESLGGLVREKAQELIVARFLHKLAIQKCQETRSRMVEPEPLLHRLAGPPAERPS